MQKEVYVAVSTDPIKNFEDIIEYAKDMQDKADLLHCDVMDGNFVENKTYNSSMVENLNQNTSLMLDVHLMCEEPLQSLENYIKAGANILTVHYEAFAKKENLVKALQFIKKNKVLAGLSIKPNTPFKEVKMYCYNIDVLLIMSVEPGKSGQKFIPEVLEKIAVVDKFRKENNLNFKIEVDGGVDLQNAKILKDYGVDILVSGSCVYRAENKANIIEELKK